MRKWIGIPLALLFVVGLVPSAWANSELHPGGRLFYPLWDVSTSQRLTFIIVTREALNANQSIVTSLASTANQTVTRYQNVGTGNCKPRGNFDSERNVNRGSSASPAFYDDLHFEYYGKSCESRNETIHMSCGDIDLFLLASANNPVHKPRSVFSQLASEGRGALDVHLVENTFANKNNRKLERSLLGHAVISDIAEGWAATYPAAAAKATFCFLCGFFNGFNDFVGYENYPMEVYLPFALADHFPTGNGELRNVLSLWGPGLFPGAVLDNTNIDIDWRWWDGRERFKGSSIIPHSIIAPLGGDVIGDLDSPLDPAGFRATNFECGLSGGGGTGKFTQSGKAENDGFPRSTPAGGNSTNCGPALAAGDPAHPSDNFEDQFETNIAGHTIQSSTPIGWWRFQLNSDQKDPIFGNNFNIISDHSGRGLVGVVLSSAFDSGTGRGVADATRLWHKDPCKLAESGETMGPPHLRDRGAAQSAGFFGIGAGSFESLFNIFTLPVQQFICRENFNVGGFSFETTGAAVLNAVQQLGLDTLTLSAEEQAELDGDSD